MSTSSIVTHAVVLLLGLIGLTGRLALPRGRRTAAGLVLMALAMFVLSTGVQDGLGRVLGGPVHVLLFGTALWLLIGPLERRRDVPDTAPDTDVAREPSTRSAGGASQEIPRRAMSHGCGCNGVPPGRHGDAT